LLRVGFFIVRLEWALMSPVHADDAGTQAPTDYERSKHLAEGFWLRFNSDIMAPTNASVTELQTILSEPFPEDKSLETAMKQPAYHFRGGDAYSDMKWLRWSDALQPVEKELSNPQQVAEYMRRNNAVSMLAYRDPSSALRFIVSRKDKLPPTVYDVVLSVGESTWCEDFVRATAKTLEGKQKWQQLAYGKNPVHRMFAVRWSKSWAEPAAHFGIWEAALGDEYWYTRLLALRFIAKEKPTGAKQALTTFRNRTVAPNLVPEFQAKERELSDLATEALRTVKEQSK